MRNITLKIDDETYRSARVRAAQAGTSVSAVVRKYLSAFAAGVEDDGNADRVKSLMQLYARADARASPREHPVQPLTRDEIYAEGIR